MSRRLSEFRAYVQGKQPRAPRARQQQASAPASVSSASAKTNVRELYAGARLTRNKGARGEDTGGGRQRQTATAAPARRSVRGDDDDDWFFQDAFGDPLQSLGRDRVRDARPDELTLSITDALRIQHLLEARTVLAHSNDSSLIGFDLYAFALSVDGARGTEEIESLRVREATAADFEAERRANRAGDGRPPPALFAVDEGGGVGGDDRPTYVRMNLFETGSLLSKTYVVSLSPTFRSALLESLGAVAQHAGDVHHCDLRGLYDRRQYDILLDRIARRQSDVDTFARLVARRMDRKADFASLHDAAVLARALVT